MSLAGGGAAGARGALIRGEVAQAQVVPQMRGLGEIGQPEVHVVEPGQPVLLVLPAAVRPGVQPRLR